MIVEELTSLLLADLIMQSPRLSGNMKDHIKIVEFGEHTTKIEISAEFYDTNLWRKSGVITFTGANYDGITNYPMWVNEIGAFGKHNKSEHWVNREVNNVCETIANEYNGEVRNELEL